MFGIITQRNSHFFLNINGQDNVHVQKLCCQNFNSFEIPKFICANLYAHPARPYVHPSPRHNFPRPCFALWCAANIPEWPRRELSVSSDNTRDRLWRKSPAILNRIFLFQFSLKLHKKYPPKKVN